MVLNEQQINLLYKLRKKCLFGIFTVQRAFLSADQPGYKIEVSKELPWIFVECSESSAYHVRPGRRIYLDV